MGWAAFFKFKGALCNRYVPIHDRIALFISCITPCVLYACGTWTMTDSMERRLRCTQRRMLRRMIKVPRKELEAWPDYIQRSTHICEDIASKHGCADWVATQHQRKCQLAGKCALSEDGRWACRLLQWRPWFRCAPLRDVGHPKKRWTDQL